MSVMAATIHDQPSPHGLESSYSPMVSVVLPCLNEEAAIGACLQKILATFVQAQLHGEIIVCDNGSTDRSVAIAESMGVRVVHQPERGYGNAYLKGFASAKGTYLVMGDADDTYDFTMIPTFIEKLRAGHDFVTGSRYLEGGHATIPFLHRCFGNPLLTTILNVLFKTKYTDVYCGFRAFSRRAYDLIQPVSPGMEFNLELAINAGLAGLKTTEVPIHLHERKGESKLRTFRDGWRSLRMMLVYCPNKVFFVPGFLCAGAWILRPLRIPGGRHPVQRTTAWYCDRDIRNDLQCGRISDSQPRVACQDLFMEPTIRCGQQEPFGIL